MSEYKTPGVYVVEKNAFPNSVVEVPTAVPVFIGYTETARQGARNVRGQPVRLTAMREFIATFGGPPPSRLTFTAGTDALPARLAYADETRYLLYHSMRLFFDNGGGPCWVISAGDYRTPIAAGDLWNDDIADALTRELEPTMIVIPEATQLKQDDWKAKSEAVLVHCMEMQSRIAILDVRGVDRPAANGAGGSVSNLIRSHAAAFREVTADKPSYGVAYYPWLRTTIVADQDIDIRCIAPDARGTLLDAVNQQVEDAKFPDARKAGIGKAAKELGGYKDLDHEPATKEEADAHAAMVAAHRTLFTASPLYKQVMQAARPHLNLLPPGAAMAGVYSRIDNEFGVFRAPANTGLVSVAGPSLDITHAEQEDLNVPLDGKAINAIRAIPGRGVMVWGARTLDGNSQDWRYVNVRRTIIMLEQSIKAAAHAYVFQPNTAATWITVQSMIANYLTNKWKEGALMGATADEAFSVDVGLGSTMSANDILDGYMRITIKVALVRPAEFIELTFVQKMLSES